MPAISVTGRALAVCAAFLAIAGCKSRKHEPLPGPQVPLASAASAIPAVSGRSSAQLVQFAEVGPVAQRLVQGTHR